MIVSIIHCSPCHAACVILFLRFPLKHAIGTYVSRGILKIVEFNVFGLNVININESPLKLLLCVKSFVSLSIPINKMVNGSFNDLPALTSCFTDFFCVYITFVSSAIFLYASIDVNID